MNKLTKLSLIIFFTICVKSIATSKENFFNQALELYNQEKYQDARFLFERNIVFNPNDANSYLYLAKIYKYEKDQRKEEYNLETTLLIEPNNEDAILMMMQIALEKSNYEKVKDLSERFSKVCNKLCNENDKIQDSLKNIQPENNES
tara:strand:- start:464 stop:904 length:441 start_codon:yes stop_codon:yes gene_type:complete